MPSIMFLNRFEGPILAGTKRQTIRPPRKRPVKVGEALSLRVWTGKAYRSPQRTLLDTRCSATFAIRIWRDAYCLGDASCSIEAESSKRDEFAQADGFASWDEFIEHFDGFYGLPFTGVLIMWEPPNG